MVGMLKSRELCSPPADEDALPPPELYSMHSRKFPISKKGCIAGVDETWVFGGD